MAQELIYLYCVSEKGANSKDLDLDNIYCIYHEGLYAVISKVPEDEFGEESLKENLANLDWIKEKAIMHEKIIERIMRNSCVIPFKFGTIFNSEDNLKAMLDEHADEFRVNLEDLEGKEEWGVKIYCDIDKLKESLLKEGEELLKTDKEIRSSSPGKAFFLKKKKEELLNTAVNEKISEYGQASFNRLKKQSVSMRINKLLPKEVTEKKEDMILNSAFLINQSKQIDFFNALGHLRERYADKGLFFDCTGPWPPYNFCTISSEKVKNG